MSQIPYDEAIEAEAVESMGHRLWLKIQYEP